MKDNSQNLSKFEPTASGILQSETSRIIELLFQQASTKNNIPNLQQMISTIYNDPDNIDAIFDLFKLLETKYRSIIDHLSLNNKIDKELILSDFKRKVWAALRRRKIDARKGNDACNGYLNAILYSAVNDELKRYYVQKDKDNLYGEMINSLVRSNNDTSSGIKLEDEKLQLFYDALLECFQENGCQLSGCLKLVSQSLSISYRTTKTRYSQLKSALENKFRKNANIF